MKEYIVKKTAKPSGVCDGIWESVEPVVLDCVWDDVFPSPYTTLARMVHSDEGITVKMTSSEWPLTITATELNTTVCIDSCMEFFFTPNALDKNYINIEINPNGAAYCAVNFRRGDSELIAPCDIETLGIRSAVYDDRWEIEYTIPASFIQKYIPTYRHGIGAKIRGNFYKCGDLTDHEHYG